MKPLANNLLNVRLGDPVYAVVRQRVVSEAAGYLGERERKLLAAAQLQIAAADNYFLHYAVHPVLAPSNPDPLLSAVLAAQREYAASDAFRQARAITVLDDDLSMIHSIAFTRELVQRLMEQLKSWGEEQLDQLLDNLAAGEGSGGEPQLPQLSEKAVKEAVKAAAAAARETAETAKDLMRLGLGAGKEKGSFRAVLDLAGSVKQVRYAREIVAMAKRVTDSLPRFAKIEKKKDKRGTVFAGFSVTANPERAAPREFALPDELFYAKLASGSLLRTEKLTVREGAYYVLLDKSGSMSGEKTVWARSVALALLSLARKRRRRFFLRFFDSAPHDLLSDSDFPALLESLLKVASDGGTSIDSAIRVALEDLKKGYGDLANTIVVITDGEDTVTVSPKELEEAGATLVAVMIAGSNDTLRRLAELSKGQYLRAAPTEEGALLLLDALRKR